MLTRELRALLWLFAALALSAGVLLYLLSGNTDDTFSWTIKPSVTAAFLGGAYWAAFVLFAWSARQDLWVRARPFVLPVSVIAILLLVATVMHDDKFHKDSVFGWFWIVAYIVVPPALAIALWTQFREPAVAAPPPRPLPPALRMVLVLEALVLAGVGISLFVAPDTADSLWPWPLTPLTSQALGAWAVGTGTPMVLLAWAGRRATLTGAAVTSITLAALLSLALVRFSAHVDWSSAGAWIYAAFLAALGILGAAALVLGRAEPAPDQRLVR